MPIGPLEPSKHITIKSDNCNLEFFGLRESVKIEESLGAEYLVIWVGLIENWHLELMNAQIDTHGRGITHEKWLPMIGDQCDGRRWSRHPQ
ncbi:hypothetical protein PanWU01x14_208300 [Parasponia andersonii]|uniref:Uncharacterized protein n=1 Tax=Parasponia andersonii TaxID=3476 RepID=A0A2P5BUW4_PARAD|nr:hypothetical protein PanWU01x14_208300 [Parasponia andersonii]